MSLFEEEIKKSLSDRSQRNNDDRQVVKKIDSVINKPRLGTSKPKTDKRRFKVQNVQRNEDGFITDLDIFEV